LAEAILPEIVPENEQQRQALDGSLDRLGRLADPGFPLALAALLGGLVKAASARRIGRRWKLSNKETDRIAWLVEHREALRDARSMPWSQLQPLLIHDGIGDLLTLTEAGGVGAGESIAYCRAKLELPPAQLDPPPLLTGDDLVARGLPPGPQFRELLDRVRTAQLDGEIHTREEAWALIEG
jgi:hypothetical protein